MKRGVLAGVVCVALLLAGMVLLKRSRAVVPTPKPPAAKNGAPLVSLPPQPSAASVSGPLDELERRLFEVTNEQRTRAGLRPLGADTGLSAAARSHSEDMLRRQFFAHVNPDRETPQDRMARISDVPSGGVGENIWMWAGSIVPPREALVQQAIGEWMASPAHRQNILRTGYARIGVGAAADATNVRLTEVFRE